MLVVISTRKLVKEDAELPSRVRQSIREREREAEIADQCRSSSHSTVSATNGCCCRNLRPGQNLAEKSMNPAAGFWWTLTKFVRENGRKTPALNDKAVPAGAVLAGIGAGHAHFSWLHPVCESSSSQSVNDRSSVLCAIFDQFPLCRFHYLSSFSSFF